MTLDALIEYARGLLATPLACIEIGEVHRLASGLVDLLGEHSLCGVEPPEIVSLGNGQCGVLVDDRGDALTVEETRVYCAMVLRTADKAQEQNR